MSEIAVGFVPERLIEARKSRSLGIIDLANLVDINQSSISRYENGHQTPKRNILSNLAKALRFSEKYFYRQYISDDDQPIFWRAKLSAQATALDRAKVRLVWLKEIVDYLGEFFDFPQLNLGDPIYADPSEISLDTIEKLATDVRLMWGVRPGPMPDIIEKLELSGVFVSRIHINAEKVDAFSQWSDRTGLPFIVLSRDKASACRQRFDAAHELGHLLLHRQVNQKHMNNKQTYKLIERQADYFASFLLLPEYDFVNDMYSPSLDSLLSLKERWGVSVAAMVMRCRGLGIIDEAQTKRIWINYNRRGWRKAEPMDNRLEPEAPHLIRRSFEMLMCESVQTPTEILDALPFPSNELEELADLDVGSLSGKLLSSREPKLKTNTSVNSNVISLDDYRNKVKF